MGPTVLDRLGLYEHRVVMHVHSRYSDGSGEPQRIVEEAQRAGVDVLWLTDHDTRRALEVPGAGYYGHLLLLVGVEITPPTNHYLALGQIRLIAPTESLQTVIDHVAAEGGLGFIAHPDDPGNRTARLPSYRWTDRGVDGFAGLEIWNHLSDWSRSVTSIPAGLMALRRPHRRLSANPKTLALWDALGQARRVVGIGGADAHAAVVGKWPLRLTIFPYRTSFKGIRTHVYTENPLPANWLEAETLLMDAMARGRVAVVNAGVGEELGFRLWAEHPHEPLVAIGGEACWNQGYRVKGLAPVPVRWEIWHDGQLTGRMEGTLCDWPVAAPGVWRVVLRRGRADEVWIYSNPIYMR